MIGLVIVTITRSPAPATNRRHRPR
jgi:hypothetical protein